MIMLNIIACVDRNNAIGYNNKLLYNISEDMDFFKKMTIGKTVVMGRKTYYSLRKRPLPNRLNIIMTKANITACGVITARNISELNLIIKSIDNDIFVIGGESVYRQLLPYCKYAYITKVFDAAPKCDTYFPELDENWVIKEISPTMCENDTEYQRYIYENINVKPIKSTLEQ